VIIVTASCNGQSVAEPGIAFLKGTAQLLNVEISVLLTDRILARAGPQSICPLCPSSVLRRLVSSNATDWQNAAQRHISGPIQVAVAYMLEYGFPAPALRSG
jgi:hypothetical protein